MPAFNSIQFITSDKNLSVYKILVFTADSYKCLINERGSNYVLDLFIEVCNEKNCEFLGLESKGGYIYALLGFDFRGKNEQGQERPLSAKWGNSISK